MGVEPTVNCFAGSRHVVWPQRQSVAREIRRRRPELPIVLTTGFSEAAAAANQDGLRLLVKPYRIEQLAAELQAARNDPRAAGAAPAAP